MTRPNLVRLTLTLLLGSVVLLSQAPETQTQPAPEPAPPTATEPVPAPAQPPPAQSGPKHLLFGGTVTQLDSQHITVSRTLPGKNPEHRTFMITGKTRMSRAVKLRSLVTVRYRHLPDGDVALEVQLRPSMRGPRAS
jgi:hypothetical protein